MVGIGPVPVDETAVSLLFEQAAAAKSTQTAATTIITFL
jgi:hypothetical protein